MRNMIIILLVTSGLFISCKKSITHHPVPTPQTGFALDYMEVEENLYGANLYLYGYFGDSSSNSKVKIGNTIIDGTPRGDGLVLSWLPYMIKVSISDPNDDAGAGYVSVMNGGKETNKRMLNVWELSLLYKEPDEGTILKEIRFKTFLRADAGPHRELATLMMPSSFSARSEADWAIGGQGHASYTGGGMTVSLEDHQGVIYWNKPFEDNANEDHNFQSEIKFKDGVFTLSGLRAHKANATLMSRLADGSPVPNVTDYPFQVEVVPLNETVAFELDNDHAIKGGSFITGPHGTEYDFAWAADEATNHLHLFTLEWSKTTARFNL